MLSARSTAVGGDQLLRRGGRDRLRGRRRQRPVPLPRSHLHARALDLHRDRVELAVGLRLRRRVAEQIVRARIPDDLLHADVEIVAIQDRATIGLDRQGPERVLRAGEELAIGRRDSPAGRCRTRRPAARADRRDRSTTLFWLATS